MKNREELKESIRRKSAAKLMERARRRRAALSGVVCVVLVMGAAGVWQIRGSAAGEGDSLTMGTAPLEGDSVGSGSENGCETGLTEEFSSPKTEAAGDVGNLFNATYTAPDSMRIYTLPHTDNAREISLSAQNADEREIITQMSDWISALDVTQTRGALDDSAVTYVIERRYGENVAIVYVQGNRVKFEGGEWLDCSGEDEKKFKEMMQKIFA